MAITEHVHYCERCGAELLPADPAPLCATCWVSDTSVYAPSLLLITDTAWKGTLLSRPAPPSNRKHFWSARVPARLDEDGTPARPHRSTRKLAIVVACITVVALILAIVPAAISATTPGPVHLGRQKTDAATDACLANLYILIGDKVAHRDSPSDIVCPVTGKPYIYTQYHGVTTISCPNPAEHKATRVYVRSDVRVPVVN